MSNRFRKQAIKELVNHTASFSFDENGEIVMWVSDTNTPQPSEEAIEAKLIELQAEYQANQYQRDRAEQYPSIQDVVVALAEKEEGDDSMWQKITAQRAKVKTDNPKP